VAHREAIETATNPGAEEGQAMGENEQEREDVGLDEDRGHGRDLVTILINGVDVEIHRGRRSVAELKRAGGVPEADVLAQQLEGKLRELADDGHVVIKGGEQFVSYPRACASS
jgi:predicted Rdx family selenoprotein